LPVFHPRTRLVNFRVSEDEFVRLKEGCLRAGARSVSDYARAAVLTEVAAGPTLPILELSDRWNRLEARLDAILSSSPQEGLAIHRNSDLDGFEEEAPALHV
jgi:hypothetical protein